MLSGDCVLRPVGDMDIAQAEQLRAKWYAVLERSQPDDVIVNITGVTLLDSSG